MVTITSAAPIDGPAILPNALIDQHIKPGDEQAALMNAFRLTALSWVENHTSHSLKRRRWVAAYNGFDDKLRLPASPCATSSLLAMSIVTALLLTALACGGSRAPRSFRQ